MAVAIREAVRVYRDEVVSQDRPEKKADLRLFHRQRFIEVAADLRHVEQAGARGDIINVLAQREQLFDEYLAANGLTISNLFGTPASLEKPTQLGGLGEVAYRSTLGLAMAIQAKDKDLVRQGLSDHLEADRLIRQEHGISPDEVYAAVVEMMNAADIPTLYPGTPTVS
jgi:hypothetical protein